MLLLEVILDYSGDALQPFYEHFYQFFKINIQSEERILRIQTLKCLIHLFDNITYMNDKQINLFKDLIPSMLNILDECVNIQDEENIFYCLDAFAEMAEA